MFNRQFSKERTYWGEQGRDVEIVLGLMLMKECARVWTVSRWFRIATAQGILRRNL
jgi:hypothetical protein